MSHRQASELLPSFASGGLAEEQQALVAAHLERCSACREWLSVYYLLVEGLAGGPSQQHVSSDLLARSLSDPDSLSPAERESALSHLHNCASCREEAELVEQALCSARPGRISAPLDSRRAGQLRLALALAASVAFVWLGFGLLRGRIEEPTVPIKPRTPAPVLTGRHVIESDRPLALSTLRVADHSDVLFSASDRMTLGDRFRVGSGAKVSFRVTGSASRQPAASPDVPSPSPTPRGP